MGSPDSSGDGKTSPFGDGKGGTSPGIGRKPVDRITDPSTGGGGTGVSGKFDEMQTTPMRQQSVTKHYDHSAVDMVGEGNSTEGRLPFGDTDPSTTAVAKGNPKGAGSPGASKPFKLRGG